MEKLPISVFLITLNEADRVAQPILAVRDWVEEVVVVDSGSTDGTEQIVTSLGARFFHHPWSGYGRQKRFAEERCRHDWLLNLDADEEPTPALCREIQALFARGTPPMQGYVIRIVDLLPGEARLSRFAHVNRCLRLYDRRAGRFSESPVHDSVQMDRARAATLREPALHRSFRSLAHAVEKMNRYTTAQAADLAARGKRVPAWRLLAEFPVAFFKATILRGYALRGFPGLSFALVYAIGRHLRLAKTREIQRRE